MKAGRYEAIDLFHMRLRPQLAHDFSDVLDVTEHLAELMLWGMERLPRTARGNKQADPITATTSLLVRLFNDFEAVKVCALAGLPDQGYGALRDTIECTMLLRLFQLNPGAAARWLTHGTEHNPKAVYALLDAEGIAVPEYAQYSMLSNRSHANLAGSLGAAEETDHGAGNINTLWGLGGFYNRTAITGLLYQRCMLLLMALRFPLEAFFMPHFSPTDRAIWSKQAKSLTAAVAQLFPYPRSSSDDDPNRYKSNVGVQRQNKKMQKFEKQLLLEMRKLLGDDFSFKDV